MWRRKERIALAPHAKVTRRYEVPTNLAAYMTNVAAAEAARQRAIEKGSFDWSARSLITFFEVDFKGKWADESWADPANGSRGRYGDSMPLGPPPRPAPRAAATTAGASSSPAGGDFDGL